MEFVKGIAEVIYWLILFIPFLVLGLTVYPYKGKGKTLFKELGLSVIILITVVLLDVFLFRFLAYSNRHYAPVFMIILVIITIITGVFIWWSKKNDYHKTFFIACLLLGIEVFFLAILSTAFYSEFMFVTILLWAVAALFVPLSSLGKYTEENKDPFSRNCILLALYFILLLLFMLVAGIGNIGGQINPVSKGLWLGITALQLPLSLLIYSLSALKKGRKIAGTAAFLALMSLIPAMVGFGIHRMAS